MSLKKSYPIVIKWLEEGYTAESPDLKVGIESETLPEALTAIKREMEMAIARCMEDGRAVPEPYSVGDSKYWYTTMVDIEF